MPYVKYKDIPEYSQKYSKVELFLIILWLVLLFIPFFYIGIGFLFTNVF